VPLDSSLAPDRLLLTYNVGGLWAVLRELAISKRAQSWGVSMPLKAESIDIRCEGISDSISWAVKPELEESSLRKIRIVKEVSRWLTLIPISLFKRCVFYFRIETSSILYEDDLRQTQSLLELMLLKESFDLESYPTFMPLLIPIGGHLFKINRALTENKSLYFLNGQTGTGKKTFIQCLLLLKYRRLVELRLRQNLGVYELSIANDRIVIIPEIARLSTKSQLALLSRYENQEVSRLIINSVYDPEQLQNHKILDPRFVAVCMSERLIFPSLLKRKSAIDEMMYFWGTTKALATFIQSVAPLKMENFKANISDLKASVFTRKKEGDKSTSFNKDWQDQLRKGGMLRSVTAEMEAKAIMFAHSIVGDSQNKIADYLGISRGSLQYKIKKYGLVYRNWDT